ncbi:MAG: hypothetical protein Q8L05_07615 [Actinomycetota bacterium]|nr:hypothetical protein [Actinomycetota bacterium]MDP2288304.1 hypothetical protein [Actinomycetota bacterium]
MKIQRTIYFVAGAAVGYLAGAAAGRERYEAIMSHMSQFAQQAGVPEFGSRLADRTVDVARTATDAAGDLIDTAADKATGTVEEVTKQKKSGS